MQLARNERPVVSLSYHTYSELVIHPYGCIDSVSGEAVPNLYVAGPLRRGTLWENIAVPELRQEARALAVEIGNARPADAVTMPGM